MATKLRLGWCEWWRIFLLKLRPLMLSFRVRPSLPLRVDVRRAGELRMAGKITQGKVHGEGGVYVGGYWKTLEECKSEFNIAGGSNEKAVPAIRSATALSAAKEDGTYDVAIIGAGCIGAAVARELAAAAALAH